MTCPANGYIQAVLFQLLWRDLNGNSYTTEHDEAILIHLFVDQINDNEMCVKTSRFGHFVLKLNKYE